MMWMILQSPRLWTVLGAGLAGIAVALGAYGWHDLEGDAAMREIFMLAVQYHMWHALALLAVSWRCSVSINSAKPAALAGVFFSAGIILFCGNLYGFAITGTLPVSGAAPLGGIAFMSGWGLLAFSALRQKS
jgi:uncharacterized membrane protein YgdD (TMEM256/DUF423 family)